jgi:hypothetical protein
VPSATSSGFTLVDCQRPTPEQLAELIGLSVVATQRDASGCVYTTAPQWGGDGWQFNLYGAASEAYSVDDAKNARAGCVNLASTDCSFTQPAPGFDENSLLLVTLPSTEAAAAFPNYVVLEHTTVWQQAGTTYSVQIVGTNQGIDTNRPAAWTRSIASWFAAN